MFEEQPITPELDPPDEPPLLPPDEELFKHLHIGAQSSAGGITSHPKLQVCLCVQHKPKSPQRTHPEEPPDEPPELDPPEELPDDDPELELEPDELVHEHAPTAVPVL